MKWILALLVSIGMFYLGYHHAARYGSDKPEPNPPAEEPTVSAAAPGPDSAAATSVPPSDPVSETPETVAEIPKPSAPEPDGEPEPAIDPTPEITTKLVDHPPLDFASAGSRDRADSPTFEAALEATFQSGDWTAYRDYLRASLTPFLLARARSARDLDTVREGQRFARAHSQERFLSRFPQPAVSEAFADKEFARWLLANIAALNAAYDHLTDEDDPAAVVGLLHDLFQETRDDLLDYTRLAIACALVHDDSQGSAVNRFFWYVKQDKSDRLYRDLKSMPVSDLCLVVDGLNLKELEWVQNEYRRKAPRNGTGKVYSDIKYRMDFVTGETSRSEVYEGYTLAQIKEHGGVCSDQTHFATHVCRALGIPAVGLSGSGDRGAHAWVGYQNDDGTWTTHGRYEDYANGSFRDPQTRRRAIESELVLRSEPEFRSPVRLTSLQHNFRLIAQLADAGELERATELAEGLLVRNRSYLPGWERLFEIYSQRRSELTGDGPLTASHVITSIREFEMALKEFPDLLERADETLTATLEGVLDTGTQLKIIKRRRHRVESVDEARLLAILELIRQEAEIYQKSGDHDAVTALYRRELRTGADDVQHFMKLADDYWGYSAGVPDREKAALQLISSRVKSNFGDNLKSNDWFTKDTAIKPHAQLAGFYRKAGQIDRAERIEKDLARVRKELRETRS